MQIKLRRASLAGPSERSSAACGSLRTFSKGQILSNDAMIVHEKPSDLSPQSRTLTTSGSLQILARDPASNQYT